VVLELCTKFVSNTLRSTPFRSWRSFDDVTWINFIFRFLVTRSPPCAVTYISAKFSGNIFIQSLGVNIFQKSSMAATVMDLRVVSLSLFTLAIVWCLCSAKTCQIYLTWKYKMAATANLNFEKYYRLRIGWSLVGRCNTAMRKWRHDQKSKPEVNSRDVSNRTYGTFRRLILRITRDIWTKFGTELKHRSSRP